jgi:hypothetical protein
MAHREEANVPLHNFYQFGIAAALPSPAASQFPSTSSVLLFSGQGNNTERLHQLKLGRKTLLRSLKLFLARNRCTKILLMLLFLGQLPLAIRLCISFYLPALFPV